MQTKLLMANSPAHSPCRYNRRWAGVGHTVLLPESRQHSSRNNREEGEAFRRTTQTTTSRRQSRAGRHLGEERRAGKAHDNKARCPRSADEWAPFSRQSTAGGSTKPRHPHDWISDESGGTAIV